MARDLARALVLLALAAGLPGCAGPALHGALSSGERRCEAQPAAMDRLRCYEDTVSRYSSAAPQTAVAFLRDARWIRTQLVREEVDEATALEWLEELRRVAAIVAGEEMRLRQAAANAQAAAAWQGAADSLLLWEALQPRTSTTRCSAFGDGMTCQHR